MAKSRLFLDTNEDAERVFVELARRLSASEKIEQAAAATESTRAFALAGLRLRYPRASRDELHRRLAALVLDRETVNCVYGWDPEIEGY